MFVCVSVACFDHNHKKSGAFDEPRFSECENFHRTIRWTQRAERQRRMTFLFSELERSRVEHNVLLHVCDKSMK